MIPLPSCKRATENNRKQLRLDDLSLRVCGTPQMAFKTANIRVFIHTHLLCMYYYYYYY